MPLVVRDLSFYSTAAQVIPVILLVLAFEFRGRGFVFLPEGLLADLNPGFRAVYTILLALALFLGEAGSFFVLGTGRTSLVAEALIGACMVFGGLGIIAPILLIQFNEIAALPAMKKLRPVAAPFAAGLFASIVGALITAVVPLLIRLLLG
jgi:hypothetical protein